MVDLTVNIRGFTKTCVTGNNIILHKALIHFNVLKRIVILQLMIASKLQYLPPNGFLKVCLIKVC